MSFEGEITCLGHALIGICWCNRSERVFEQISLGRWGVGGGAGGRGIREPWSYIGCIIQWCEEFRQL